MLKISRLTVEHLSQGCVTDEEQPRVSFQIESDRQNVSLKKAKIWVGDRVTDSCSIYRKEVGSIYRVPGCSKSNG